MQLTFTVENADSNNAEIRLNSQAKALLRKMKALKKQGPDRKDLHKHFRPATLGFLMAYAVAMDAIIDSHKLIKEENEAETTEFKEVE